jgi:cytochrome P450
VVHALLISPLRKVPGPLLARLSPLWLRSIDMSGTRTKTLHKLHEKYGNTVVIGPNEVTTNDISNVNELYGQQTTFIKAPVYESMTMPPFGIFGLRDRVAHGQRRKLLSHAFSQSNLQECEPLIRMQIE